MAVLNAAARNALPSSSFAMPSQRAFPIQDPAHARNALARAHYAPNPGAIRAAVARRFPAIDVRNAVRGKMRAVMGK